jgi:hypothetical protein
MLFKDEEFYMRQLKNNVYIIKKARVNATLGDLVIYEKGGKNGS